LIQASLTIAYPGLVYLALQVASPRTVGLCILGLLALRLALVSRHKLAAYARLAAPVAAAFIVTSLASLVWNDPVSLLLAPVLVNFALLCAFGSSLTRRETLVETLALAQAGSLSAEERAYCRRLTAVWCAFFLANGAIAGELAFAGTREAWALYTGAIAYAAMALLFAVEFIYRHWRFRRYIGLPTDPLLRRIFPPDASR
jgi:uncharacterized membrane protein